MGRYDDWLLGFKSMIWRLKWCWTFVQNDHEERARQIQEEKKDGQSNSPRLVSKFDGLKEVSRRAKHPPRLCCCRAVSGNKPSTQRSAEDSRCWNLHAYRPWSSGFRSLIRSFWTLCLTSDEYLPFISNCLPFLNHWAATLGTENWQDSVQGWPSLPDVSCRCFSTSTSETQRQGNKDSTLR